MKGIIYCYHCIFTGKKYIGKTLYENKRKHDHLYNINSGVVSKFYNAVRKYKFNNFIYGIIEVVDVDILDDIEKYYINYYDTMKTGYNMTAGGEGKSGWKASEKTKKKMRDKAIGRVLSQETKDKISESKKGSISPFRGKNHTEETKQKIRNKKIGVPFPGTHNNHKETKWWNNGQINKRSVECPGKEWQHGRLPLRPYNRNMKNVQ
jgi:group I intron endonuclease